MTQDMKGFLAYIDEHLDNITSPEQMAEYAGFSYYYFCHEFRALQGISPGAYLRNQRLKRAAKKLSAGALVKEAAATGGFETVAGFSKAFKRTYGVNATEYRLKAQM